AVPVGRGDREARELDGAGGAERRREDEILLALERARRAGRYAHGSDRLARAHVLGEQEPGTAVVLVGHGHLVAAGAAIDLPADVQGAGDGCRILAAAEPVAAPQPGGGRALL